jgi:hypothetical protein
MRGRVGYTMIIIELHLMFYFELEGIRPIEKRQEVQIILEDDNPICNDLIGLMSK